MSYRSYHSSLSSYPRRQTTLGSSYTTSRYTASTPDRTPSARRMDPYWMLAAQDTYNRVVSPSYLDDTFGSKYSSWDGVVSPSYLDNTFGSSGDKERDFLGLAGSDDELPNDDVYVDKLGRVLSAPPCIGVPPQPSCLINGLYIGTQANGENLDCLKRHKITYVLNCAGLPSSLKHARASRYEGTNIIYEELPIDDDEGFQIKNYFGTAHTFLDRARLGGGRVLVHCTGVSRCGAIVISYLVRNGRRLLEATKDVKRERRCVLCNTSFMKQLVSHARQHGMLDPEPGDVRAPKYGRELDKRRIWSAHLPMVL